MDWKVKLAQYAQDKLAALPAKERLQISSKIQARLVHRPLPDGKVTVKLTDVKTPDGHPIYRLRSGDYRVLYLIMREREVYVLDVISRAELDRAIQRFS